MRRSILAALAAGLCVLPALWSGAESSPATGTGVLVVVNGADAVSLAIGERYRTARGIAPDRLLALETETAETISRETFEREIRDPLEAFLHAHGWVEAVHTIVVTKGVPLRVVTERDDGAWILDGREASVDAEIALLFSGRDGEPAFGDTPLANPYFDSPLPFAAFRAAHPESPLRYVVARLTGYSDAPDGEGVPHDIARLIEQAREPGEAGVYVIDEDPGQPPSRRWGNDVLLGPAAAGLQGLGVPVLHDRSAGFVQDVDAIAGYASWGSNDSASPPPPFYGLLEEGLVPGRFTARAIAMDLVSTNARSFRAPPDYGQSLLADWVAMGVGGAAGHVLEPTLGRVARPDVLMRRYAAGTPAGEAYFRSLTHLGWVNVWIGDPLMVCDREASLACVTAVPSPPTGSIQAAVGLALAAMRGRRRRAGAAAAARP